MEIKNKMASEGSDWKKINENWLKSGLTQKQFCQRHQISYSTFITARSVLVRSGLMANSQSTAFRKQKQLKNEKNNSRTFIPIKMMSDHSVVDKTPPERFRSMVEVQLPQGIILRIAAHE